MASQIPYLDVQNLTKRFGAQVLFDNISFSIAEGQKWELWRETARKVYAHVGADG